MADGRKLRALRHQRGLSQQMLASEAGISPATIARLEREPLASCRGRTLARLAAALGAPAALMLAAAPPRAFDICGERAGAGRSAR